MSKIYNKFLYTFLFIFALSFIIVIFSIASQIKDISPSILPLLYIIKYSLLGLFWTSIILLLIKILPPQKIKLLIKRYAVFFVFVFIVSGMFSLVFNFFSLFFTKQTLISLSSTENTFSLLTFFLGLVLYIFASFFAVLPKRTFLPIAFFLLFTLIFNIIFRIIQIQFFEIISPNNILNILTKVRWHIFIRIIFSAIQITLGLYALKVLNRIDIIKKKLFSPFKFIAFLFFNIFMTLTITFTIVFIILYSSVNSLSNGYLTLTVPSFWNVITKFEIIPQIKLVEKIYTKKTNSVHIVGLFDMGREELYRELLTKYKDGNSVLIKDSITDTNNRLDVSPGLQNIFREIGVLKNRNGNSLEVKIAESNLDISEFNTITTDTFRNLLALFEPENFKIFFKRLIYIVENILKYIKSTASDFYSLKETGIGKNYNELQNILKDDNSWQICSEDIRKISSRKNNLLLKNTLELESEYKNIIIIGGNNEFEKDLEKSGYTLRHKTRHPFPYTTYKEYFRERINIIITLIKEIYSFIKTNTWDEFLKIFRR